MTPESGNEERSKETHFIPGHCIVLEGPFYVRGTSISPAAAASVGSRFLEAFSLISWNKRNKFHLSGRHLSWATAASQRKRTFFHAISQREIFPRRNVGHCHCRRAALVRFSPSLSSLASSISFGGLGKAPSQPPPPKTTHPNPFFFPLCGANGNGLLPKAKDR